MDYIPTDQIKPIKFNKGQKDEYLIKLIKKQMGGKISAEIVEIDMEDIEPFCKNLKSELNPDTIESFKERIKNGDLPNLLVYYKKGKFIMSDDYHAYNAYKILNSKTASCEVLGGIPNEYLKKK